METDVHIWEILGRIVIILLAAKLGGWVAEKGKQPAVLGELLVGVLLGPSLLGLIPLEGHVFEILQFLAEIGVIILLFMVGLESNIYQLLKVGVSSLSVALIGVVAPIGLGLAYYFYFVDANMIVAIFVGATLAATSVGVTMRVLSGIKKINSEEGKIILGAAVIDDILGLIILSVLGGMVATNSVDIESVGKTILLSATFLVGAIVVGIWGTPFLYKWVHRLNVKRTFVISAFVFALFLAAVADWIGLAAIVGAFAAGLVLETTAQKEHIEKKMKPVGDIFIPLFFVMAGAFMDVRALADIATWPVITILLVIAIIGKIIAGWGAFKGKVKKLAIGIGMIPRGEVGLIFASFGLGMGLIDNQLYAILVVVVMLTTFVTPPLLVKYMADIKPDKN